MAHYTEMDGWPKEQIGENGQFYAERKLKCAWADRYTVLQDIGGNGGQLYPYDPGTEAVANGALIEPFAAMDGNLTVTPIAVYEYAIITIKYSTSTLIKLSSNWLTEELQPTSKLINVDWVTPGATWDTSGDPVTAADNIVRLETSFDYVVTYYHTTSIPPAAYAEIDKVNDAPIASWLLGVSFNAETLLHTRPVITRTYDPGLRRTFRLVYRLSFNPNTWNKHFHIDAYDSTTKDPLYEKFDMTGLIPSIAP